MCSFRCKVWLLEAKTSSLSDLKNRSETGQAGKPLSGGSQNSAGRGQILPVLQVNSRSIDQKSGGICTVRADLQPISFKSDRLLGTGVRGKYLKHVNQGSNRVVLQPEIQKAFPTSAAINKALATMLAFAQETKELTSTKRTTRKQLA